LIVPGHPEGTITLPLGYGRTRAGRVGNGRGFNAYMLRTSDALWRAADMSLTKTEKRYNLALTQNHFLMEGRPLVQAGTFDEYVEHPEHPEFLHHEHEGPLPSLYPEYRYAGYKWGMVIDLTTCIGCKACVIACQSENNVPVVGKDQVSRGREMHWLRVDTYYEGDRENPQALHQPVMCVHCEKAPCEVVCPVAATVHDAEGISNMVYNRCVGTRYCSNNCPYKVRRFNFLQYADKETPVLKLLNNPDVTVRDVGVMEKCSYCIQRIAAARIEAEKRGRPIRDGEVVTACQAACPTETIVFGDLNDPESLVSQLAEHPLDYELLGELGTQPRTTYHAALRNPNPKLHGHERRHPG
jgi:molybdopterin-containing oxidoreductase family iron-sulfur binding subunit